MAYLNRSQFSKQFYSRDLWRGQLRLEFTTVHIFFTDTYNRKTLYGISQSCEEGPSAHFVFSLKETSVRERHFQEWKFIKLPFLSCSGFSSSVPVRTMTTTTTTITWQSYKTSFSPSLTLRINKPEYLSLATHFRQELCLRLRLSTVWEGYFYSALIFVRLVLTWPANIRLTWEYCRGKRLLLILSRQQVWSKEARVFVSRLNSQV